MTYLITNIQYNGDIKQLELKAKDKQKIYIKIQFDTKYQIGDFVMVNKQNNRYLIESKVVTPQDELDYYEHGLLNKAQLQESLKAELEDIENDNYCILIEHLLEKNQDYFIYPAAKSIHHSYIGGLCDHTLSMMKLAKSVVKVYPNINKSLLFAGIILHDYGKIYEMYSYGLSYSKAGNLIGHIVMVVEELVIACKELNIDYQSDEIVQLKHLLLSHHGKLEYASPKEPMLIEAYILSVLDDFDAKMNYLQGEVNKLQDDMVSPPLFGFDRRRFFKTKG